MSDPTWVGVGIGTTVGTATIDTAGQFTITAHGLVDGQPVRLDTITGGAVGVFLEDTTYYVLNAAADTFDLVSIPGDTVITLASSGGADVHTAVPHYSAPELRRADAVTLFGGTADAFGARQGVRPGHTPVSVSGTTWTVEHLTAVVYPGLATTDGPYRVQHPSESGSLDPADGTNDRIDALDLQIQDDDEDASGFRRARVVYVVGTPGSGTRGAATSNSLELATVLVPSGGTPSPSVATLARWTVASGGVPPLRDDTERPAAGLYEGMLAYRQDTDTLEVWDGSAWQALARPNAPAAGWTPIDNGSFSGSGVQIDVTDGGRYPAGTFDLMRLHLYGDLDADGTVRLKINDAATDGQHQTGLVTHDADTGAINAADHGATRDDWFIADWATVTGCTATILLYQTGATDATAYTAMGGRVSPTAAAMIVSQSWGRLTANHLVDTLDLRALTAGSNLFSECIWKLEGYRA